MKHKITVKQHTPDAEKNYDQWHEVYEQEVETLDLPALVTHINQLVIADRIDKLKVGQGYPVSTPISSVISINPADWSNVEVDGKTWTWDREKQHWFAGGVQITARQMQEMLKDSTKVD